MAEKQELTDEEIALYRETFSMFDANGDGKITVEELGAILSSVGHNPTDRELANMIWAVDVDGDGAIDFPEFLALMKRKEKERNEDEELWQSFQHFDKDGNGFISPEEIRQVFVGFGKHLPDEEIDEMIKEVDTNGDGQISYEEFYKMMKS